jgi:hypothetical protein
LFDEKNPKTKNLVTLFLECKPTGTATMKTLEKALV